MFKIDVNLAYVANMAVSTKFSKHFYYISIINSSSYTVNES